MSKVEGRIDFELLVTVESANPNGDPLEENRPRMRTNGMGEISDVCLKRKIRNRFQDSGYKIFVQMMNVQMMGVGVSRPEWTAVNG